MGFAMSKVDVTSSEIMPSPGEAVFDLSQALDKLSRLLNAAIARGDDTGAEAWREASAAVSRALEVVQSARNRQTWGAKRTSVCEVCKR